MRPFACGSPSAAGRRSRPRRGRPTPMPAPMSAPTSQLPLYVIWFVVGAVVAAVCFGAPIAWSARRPTASVNHADRSERGGRCIDRAVTWTVRRSPRSAACRGRCGWPWLVANLAVPIVLPAPGGSALRGPVAQAVAGGRACARGALEATARRWIRRRSRPPSARPKPRSPARPRRRQPATAAPSSSPTVASTAATYGQDLRPPGGQPRKGARVQGRRLDPARHRLPPPRRRPDRSGPTAC